MGKLRSVYWITDINDNYVTNDSTLSRLKILMETYKIYVQNFGKILKHFISVFIGCTII